MIGLLIPFIGGYLPANQASTEFHYAISQLSEIEISPQIENKETIYTWINLLYLIYTLGALFVFSRFIFGLSKIYSIYKNASKTKNKNYTLVESNKYHLPFSFFHYIFISKELPLNKDVVRVLKHEELHANQWHSLDIVFTELLQVFFWFNPILIFFKNALRQSHEFLADAYVTKDHNRSSYGQLLLRQSTSGLEIALANHFFHSQIKKRITMMYKEKSKRPAMVKYLAAIPVLIAMLIIFSSSQTTENVQDKNGIEVIHEEQGDPIFKVVEEMPRFPGCEDQKGTAKEKDDCARKEMLNFIFQNVKYPAEARNSGIQGMSIIQFIVEKDGKISNGTIIREIGGGCGQEALRVVNAMPNWTPGFQKGNAVRVQYTLPVKFKLEGDSSPKEIKTNLSGKNVHFISKEGTNLGSNLTKETIRVKVGEQILIEGTDYNIDYAKGTLKIINDSYLQKETKVNVTFIEKSQQLDNDKKITDDQKNLMANVKAFGKKSNKAINENLKINNDNTHEFRFGENEIYKVVEEMPRFSGCEESNMSQSEKEDCSKNKLLEFIYTNIKYPKEARQKGIEGVAVIQLIIDIDGSISSSKILRDPGAGTGVEAKRVVDLMPKWIPGKQLGRLVRLNYTLPIKFKLESGDKPNDVKKNEILNHALLITETDFRSMENIETLTAAAGIHSDCKIHGYRLVHVPKNKDEATVSICKAGTFSEFTKNQIQSAKVGDRYFLEDIHLRCSGTREANDPGSIQIKVVSNEAKIENKIVHEVDKKPLFPGASTEEESVNKLLDFVFKNVTYPKDAIQNSIEGMAIVRFVIGSDGKIQHASLKESLGWGIDENVLNMMDKMAEIETPWTPGIVENKNVNFEYVLPVKFKLQNDQIEEAKLRELKFKKLNISPNPSNGLFNLVFDIDDKSPADITFYSINGHVLKTLKKVKIPFIQSIDLSEYKGQTILINIMQKDKVHTEKIILQ